MWGLTRLIDSTIDKTTSYRLVLYVLIALLPFGFFLQNPVHFVVTLIFLVTISYFSNLLFAKVLHAPTNLESVFITALILVLILSPIHDQASLISVFLIAIFAQASKYFLVIGRKHIFNPVAISILISGSATWRITDPIALPVITIGGLLIVYKLRRFKMLIAFFVTSMLMILFSGGSVKGLIIGYPILFFAFFMFTEPLTSPTTPIWQLVYGAIVGTLFNIQSFSPELALIIGNIFSYIVSPKYKLFLTLKEKIKIAPNIYDFIFSSNKKINFEPGQYMEWTLPQADPDSRGNRRYLTLASSPTEADIRIGVKYYDSPSSFKQQLLKSGGTIVASQLAGDFVLPKDKKEKLVLVAGGIGVTPYRSMIKYLKDTNELRDIILIYINRSADEIVYKDVLEYVKTMYINTSETGHLSSEKIINDIPDYLNRTWYISGPHAMVNAIEKMLNEMKVKKIKTDFFPGLV